MGQIHYSFDPTRSYEIKDLFDFLHKLYPEIPADPKSYNKQNSSADSEKDRTIRELNDIIKKHEKENEKNNKEIESLREKLKEAEELSKMESDEVEKLSNQNKNLIDENAKNETKLRTEFKSEINKIKEEKEKEIASLNKQIESYAKKLAIYEPTLNGETGNDRFFRIEGSNLEETLSSEAPFIGKVDVEGNAIFNFNVEKGPHKHFAQNPSELENYCEIIESIEGANHIGLSEWGKGKFLNGSLVVTTKAKIKLVRE